MTSISKGDIVRAHFFRKRFNRKTRSYDRELVCTKTGVVEFVSRDLAAVKFEGQHKPERVPVSALELVTA